MSNEVTFPLSDSEYKKRNAELAELVRACQRARLV